ncbi:cytochrome P450 [Xylariaceae sp. FL0255]|nr:cytochrome P450 [Xylariaceae sp. FL0255]
MDGYAHYGLEHTATLHANATQAKLVRNGLDWLVELTHMLSETSSWFISWTSNHVSKLILLVALVIPLITRLASAWAFRKSRSLSTGRQSNVPLVPYWIPGAYHLLPFLWDTVGFAVATITRYGWENPVMVKAASTKLALIASPAHVVSVFKNSRFLSTRLVLENVQRCLLGIPSEVMPFYLADNSGMAIEPRKGSQVAQEDRILFHQAHTHHKWLASPYLDPVVECFFEKLDRHFESLEIGDTWQEYPDLFQFIQSIIIGANIETLLGSKILEMNPNLVDDFCIAKKSVPEFLKGWPRWLALTGFRARDRVISALEKWHTYAQNNGDYSSTGDSDPDWDPVWGSKCEKVRQQYMNGTKALTAHERACEDWGFLIGLNYNTPPSLFWYIFEALKDPILYNRMMNEVTQCRRPDGTFSISDLAAQPLLESAYAETLRLRVSILITRTVEYSDIDIGGLTLRRGDNVLMPIDSTHMNEEAWNRAGKTSDKSLQEFDADRFLEPSEAGPKFSLDGLAGLWIPYGGGDRMCPGRHLVKVEMLIFFAYMFSRYEIEANETDMKTVRPNRKYVSFGALPPNRPVRFRIRRKAP